MEILTALEIAAIIVKNAPEALKTVEEIYDWAKSAYHSFMANLNVPADQVTVEMLVGYLDKIKAQSAEIQKPD
jgi:hypothetical protein